MRKKLEEKLVQYPHVMTATEVKDRIDKMAKEAAFGFDQELIEAVLMPWLNKLLEIAERCGKK